MTPNDFPDLRVGLEAARLAGDYIREAYENFVPIPNAPADISTEVDRRAQEIILRHIAQHFPEDMLCAEENTPGLTRRTSDRPERVWVVDPIDGTRGFAVKNGEFTVMIGLLVQGEPYLGVVLEPVSQIFTFAVRGHGCWTLTGDGQPLRCQVRSLRTLDQAILVQSHVRPGKISRIASMLRPGEIHEMYSAGLKMAWVARGRADVYVNHYSNFSDWDICAGHVLVSEAGGRVSGLRGERIRYGQPGFKQQNGMIAASETLHESVVQALSELPWPAS